VNGALSRMYIGLTYNGNATPATAGIGSQQDDRKENKSRAVALCGQRGTTRWGAKAVSCAACNALSTQERQRSLTQAQHPSSLPGH
jgi:hypothetical protein